MFLCVPLPLLSFSLSSSPSPLQNPFLVVVVLLIASGLFMFTYESTQFNLQGFIMVLLASFIGGIRWTLTQLLMQKAELGGCWGLDLVYVCCECVGSGAGAWLYVCVCLALFTSNVTRLHVCVCVCYGVCSVRNKCWFHWMIVWHLMKCFMICDCCSLLQCQ